MPARLLAYGGTSFSERRRIGQWPAIPEATLRDGYGLTANAWCFGFGIVDKQPFLIFRQRQNVENRGGYPFSLLLDPGEAVWSRFEWNPASVADVLIRETPDALFRTPENCSADTLEKHMAALTYSGVSSSAPVTLSYLVVSAIVAVEPLGYAGRPQASELAMALAALPVCFRAGTGWLVGGALAHGRALGAMLVLDNQTSGDWGLGQSTLGAWEAVRTHAAVREREIQPAWMWPESAADFLNAVMLLRDIETSASATDELVLRAEKARALQAEIDGAVEALLTSGSGSIGPRASVMLIRTALEGKRSITQSVVERLDSATLAAELRKHGSPPTDIPKELPVSRDFHLGLWTRYLETLSSEVGRNLKTAMDQLGPAPELIASALAALPGSDEDLIYWKRFQGLEEPLRNEALRRFSRRVPGSAKAYLLLGDDPGGPLANDVLTQDEDAARLVSELKSVEKDYPEEAGAWLTAFKKSPLRKRLPKATPARAPKAQAPELQEELRRVLFESDPDAVEERCKNLRLPAARVSLDDAIPAESFAKAFYGKYLPLGCVMSYLTEESQERLLECFGTGLSGFAAEHVKHAINNKSSRSPYTSALARFLLKDRKMLKQIAGQLAFLPSEFEPKLRTLAKDKGRSWS